MRIAVDGPAEGVENMRLDQAMLDEVEASGSARARIYGWDGPWVSLGRFQRPERDLLPDCPVPWVRRPTGGRAVLHGHDVTLAMAVAFDAWLGAPAPRSPRAFADELTLPIARALARCGLAARQGAETGRPGPSADCFAHAAPTDLADARTGVKLCGAALRLSARAVLVQASIPIGPPLVDPALVFASPAPTNACVLDRTALEAALVDAFTDWAGNLRASGVRRLS